MYVFEPFGMYAWYAQCMLSDYDIVIMIDV